MLSKRFQLQAVSAAMILSLTACANPPMVMFEDPISLEALDHYRINCDDKQAQMQFLVNQYSLSHDMLYKVVARRKMDSLKECR
jgi:hypothetical protein